MTQVCSVFSQLLQPRGEFVRAIKHHFAEPRGSPDGTVRGDVVLSSGAVEVPCERFAWAWPGCEAPLKHLGISETPKKSTLAYANENRPWALYQRVFNQLPENATGRWPRGGCRKFRFKNKLVLVIDRGYNDYEWLAEMTGDGVFFVTWMKSNTVYMWRKSARSRRRGSMLRDQIISLLAASSSDCLRVLHFCECQ